MQVFWECLSENRELWKKEVISKRKWYADIRKKVWVEYPFLIAS